MDIWHYGGPAFFVAGSLAVVVSAIRSKPTGTSIRWSDWPLLLVLLILIGDAALGEARPPFERAWKGTVAVLLGASLTIAYVRRRRASAPPKL